MASCTGTKKSSPCGGAVYSCGNCTNVGCDQVQADECSNQGFRSGICMICGAIIAHELRLEKTPQLQEAMKRLRISDD